MPDYNFDLIVVGEIVNDILKFSNGNVIKRPGGVFYSSLIANSFGLKTGIIGTSGDKKNEFYDELETIGIDFSGVSPNKYYCDEYELVNVNEILPQILQTGPNVSHNSLIFPNCFLRSKAVLFYPIKEINKMIEIAKIVRENKGLVCFDLQHDIQNIELISEFLNFVDILFGSREELMEITKFTNDGDLVNYFFKYGVNLIIIKYGLGGSTIYSKNNSFIRIPAFLANYKCTIGAGDVYNGSFIYYFLNGYPIEECGEKAALTSSIFSERISFPHNSEINNDILIREKNIRTPIVAHPEDLKDIKIYLAGHFLSQPTRTWVDEITYILESRGFTVFNPYRDVGILTENSSIQEQIDFFENDINAILSSDLILALLDCCGRGGVFWEMGYGFCKNIPTFALLTDNQTPISNMIINSVKTIYPDISHLLNGIFEFSSDLLMKKK